MDKQCSSCGGFCRKSGCERENVKPEQEPVAWADYCRIELVAAIHSITSDYENALGSFGQDADARRKAEGDIAHARKIVAKWNWNGRTAPPQREWVGLTNEEIDSALGVYDSFGGRLDARKIEAKLMEKNCE